MRAIRRKAGKDEWGHTGSARLERENVTGIEEDE